MAIATTSYESVPSSRLELHWVPLGAGTSLGSRVVRFSGRVYERAVAIMRRRSPQPLFHSALIAYTPEGRCVVEMTPVPRHGHPADRGIVGGGAVGSRVLGRSRLFRYEIRRWLGGVIPDLRYATDGPVLISTDDDEVAHVLDLLAEVPPAVWGRDHARTGEMWNSNSVISWTLERAGLAGRAGTPPHGGRAPGWEAGVVVARRSPAPSERHSSGAGCGQAVSPAIGWLDRD